MTNSGIQSSNRLNEIDFMRPIVIILLVMMHSFTIYSDGGSWKRPIGIEPVSIYKWIQVITYGCMLEAFTFISGYLFGFQLRKKKNQFSSMVLSKLKRLIVPSIVFSVLYILLFQIKRGEEINWCSRIIEIISGVGHLWYLPMLFWCFIITWLLSKLKIKEGYKLIGVYIISIAKILPIPLGFSSMLQYLPFFYLGVYIYGNMSKKSTIKDAIFCLIVFLILLVLVTLYREAHPVLASWQKIALWYLKQSYATLGTLGLFFICKLWGEKFEVQHKTIQFNACCFGNYVFHQFILMILYYDTPLPLICGTYWLPWCSLLLAFSISFGLTWLLQKTKTGKFLLG